jgi:cytochrome oxidase Cu insertion factor (SCO1/SenC/PrrC family)
MTTRLAVRQVLQKFLVVLGVAVSLARPSAAAEAEPKPSFTPRFHLSDTQGRAVSDADFHGQFVLITFGYTYCPDVCPTTLQNVTLALARLGAAADKIAPLFVTIDPERDTPAQLAAYVKAFDPRVKALTGTQEQIAETARNFGVIYRKAAVQGAGAYLMDHTARLYFIGPAGQPLGKFSHTLSPGDLAERLWERMAQAEK